MYHELEGGRSVKRDLNITVLTNSCKQIINSSDVSQVCCSFCIMNEERPFSQTCCCVNVFATWDHKVLSTLYRKQTFNHVHSPNLTNMCFRDIRGRPCMTTMAVTQHVID